MILLDGRKIKEEKIQELKKDIDKLERKPSLVVIQVGNDEASNIYIRNKENTALKLGCSFKHIKLDDNVSEEVLLEKIDQLNKDKMVDGILVQMPIPKTIDEKKLQNKILPYKDVDGLSDINAGLLSHNKETLIPATALGVLEMLKYYNIDVKGKHVVIVGRSNLVGKPLLSLMLNNDATVTICHSNTTNLKEVTKLADILIVAVGKKHIITDDMVKDDAVVIDVGINRENGLIYGDVDFDNISKRASYITPVPGGVGQMTTLCLYMNLYKAYMINNKQ